MTRTDPLDVPRPDARLHFGVFFQGVNHWTIWSDPASGSQIDPANFRRVAQTAERGLFDAFFLGEGLRLREVDGLIHELDVAGRPDAITQLAALAAVTDRIGLVSTSNTTFNEPADLARRLSGLDLLSEGRAGWNVVTTDNAWTGANFRRGGYLDHADRYRRAEEFLTVARALWDGWADGAVSGTAGAPAWAAPGAVGRVRHRGAQFDVDLAPTLPRSGQSHPVIFQAGDSGEGRDFAARNADVVFSAHGNDFDDALAFAEDLRRRLLAVGRYSGTTCASCPARRSSSGRRRRRRWRRSAGSVCSRSPRQRRWVSPVCCGASTSRTGTPTDRCPRRTRSSPRTTARSVPGASPTRARWSPSGARRRRRTAGRCARPSSPSDRSAGTSAPPPDSPTGSPTGCATGPSTAST